MSISALFDLQEGSAEPRYKKKGPALDVNHSTDYDSRKGQAGGAKPVALDGLNSIGLPALKHTESQQVFKKDRSKKTQD